MVNRLVITEHDGNKISVSLLRAGQDDPESSGKKTKFTSPFGPKELEDLRWYLEDYLLTPYAVYEERGQAIRDKLPEWGKALFEAVFAEGKPGRDLYRTAREGKAELTLVSRSPAFLALPWELLRDPNRATPLALDLTAIDRTLTVDRQAASVPPGAELRVLMAIARPAGIDDVGYQMVARPLMERLAAVRGRVALDVLRPPTREAFGKRLAEAAAEGRPYHVVHFDGHGTFGELGGGGFSATRFEGSPSACGFLVFEKEGGGDDLVTAEQFAKLVADGGVPIVVLNACRSGMLGEAAVEAAVATRLLEGGAASVVAMAYSVYAVAAAEFMAFFYEALFAGRSVSEAVAAGRHRLWQNRARPSAKGPLPLEDWIVPVHYRRRTLAFPALHRPRSTALPSLDALLDSGAPDAAEGQGGGEALAPVGRFVGRDAAFYELEIALRFQRVVVLHGLAGTGKTELAKAFARWWQETGGVDQPGWVFFHSFEPGLASFGLDHVLTKVGVALYGPDFSARTRDAAHRREAIFDLLRTHRMLLIWDNFESVHDFADPGSVTPPLDPAEQAEIRAFLAALAHGGRSGIILTSRTEETWLGERRRLRLGGLTRGEAIEMAQDVLAPWPRAQAQRDSQEFEDLLDWIGGHPLSLRLLLPSLDSISAAELLLRLRGATAAAPPGFAGDGRTEALGASLTYSLDRMPAAMRSRLPVLALFEGIVDEQVLGVFSMVDGAPPRFAGLTKEDWSETLQRLAGLGVVTALGGGMYGMPPALPAYLMAVWRAEAVDGFEAEHDAAQDALLEAGAAFAAWLQNQIASGKAEIALALLERQQRTFGRLLGHALAQRNFARAQDIIEPLNTSWDARGLVQEAHGWVDRTSDAIGEACGPHPDLDAAAGRLWLFATGSEALRALRAGDLASAERVYESIRVRLEGSAASESRDRNLGITSHQLGAVAQNRGDLDGAEGWYRKSLEIGEALDDRPGLAGSYHQLGRVAEDRGDLDGAEGWYRKSLEIKEALGDRPGLARSYHQLGMVAQGRGDLDRAEGWYRKSLDIKEALGDRPGLARSYHQLGAVAQDRGEFDGAEGWYRKSLEIEEALGNRPGLATSYHQLGIVAQDRGDFDGAEGWYRRSLAIEEALGNRRGMVISYRTLAALDEARGNGEAARA